MDKEELDKMTRYERRAYNLYCEMLSPDDINKPNVISYLTKHVPNTVEITGKQFIPKPTEFDVKCNIDWCFAQIKSKLMTKGGKLRKKWENMKPYETYDWAALLNYLRQAWREGKPNVILSWKEYKMLED